MIALRTKSSRRTEQKIDSRRTHSSMLFEVNKHKFLDVIQWNSVVTMFNRCVPQMKYRDNWLLHARFLLNHGWHEWVLPTGTSDIYGSCSMREDEKMRQYLAWQLHWSEKQRKPRHSHTLFYLLNVSPFFIDHEEGRTRTITTYVWESHSSFRIVGDLFLKNSTVIVCLRERACLFDLS